MMALSRRNVILLYRCSLFLKLTVILRCSHNGWSAGPKPEKILQPRHYFKRCSRFEFYKLLALYHADSKVTVEPCGGIQNVECVDSFTYFLLLHCWGRLGLDLLNTYAKNKETKTKAKRKQQISTEASALVRLILLRPWSVQITILFVHGVMWINEVTFFFVRRFVFISRYRYLCRESKYIRLKCCSRIALTI